MDFTAYRDQQEAAARDLAHAAAQLVLALETFGFTREEAIEMVTYWMGVWHS